MNSKPQLVFESIQFSNKRSGRKSPVKNSLGFNSPAIPEAGMGDNNPQAQGVISPPSALNNGELVWEIFPRNLVE